MSSTPATLNAASSERKARLAQLKSLKRKAPSDETSAPVSTRSPSPPAPNITTLHLSGRNYDSTTRGPKLGFEAPPTLDLKTQTLEQQAKDIEDELREQARLEEEKKDEGVDLFKLQPKKPNWDLKRDLERKLEVLGVRTDNAIAVLVRERVEGAKKAAGRKGGVAAKVSDVEGAEEVGMEGVALVEGLREREREDEADRRREEEDEEIA